MVCVCACMFMYVCMDNQSQLADRETSTQISNAPWYCKITTPKVTRSLKILVYITCSVLVK